MERRTFRAEGFSLLFLCLYICSVFPIGNTSFYDLACRHSENCVENKSIAMSCGEYVLRTNEIFSCGKYQTNALFRSLRNSPLQLFYFLYRQTGTVSNLLYGKPHGKKFSRSFKLGFFFAQRNAIFKRFFSLNSNVCVIIIFC